MTERQNNSDKEARQKNRGPIYFILIIIFIIGTISIDNFIEPDIMSRVMFYIQQRSLPPFSEIYPYQLLLTMLFAFGLPAGMVLAFAYAIKSTEPSSSYSKKLILASILILSVVVVTPIIFGRELSRLFFAFSGSFIIASFLLTFWFTSKFRSRLNKERRSAMDFKLLGYLCFGIVTWEVCGLTTTPGFAIYPEKMLELEVRPFAIGQLKSIMIYFVLGWIFTAIGFFNTMRNEQAQMRSKI